MSGSCYQSVISLEFMPNLTLHGKIQFGYLGETERSAFSVVPRETFHVEPSRWQKS